MNLGIEKIKLTFENCETADIPGWMIGEFLVSDIATEISRLGINYIGKMQIANSIVIEISRLINTPFKGFGQYKEDYMLFDRIRDWNDITSIDIYYEREREDMPENFETYLVDYSERDDEIGMLGASNMNQNTYLDVCGNLILGIGKTDRVKELVDFLVARSDSEISFAHDVCSVGEPFYLAVRFSYRLPEDGMVIYVENKDEPDQGAHAKWNQNKYNELIADTSGVRSFAGSCLHKINSVFGALEWADGEDAVDKPYTWRRVTDSIKECIKFNGES